MRVSTQSILLAAVFLFASSGSHAEVQSPNEARASIPADCEAGRVSATNDGIPDPVLASLLSDMGGLPQRGRIRVFTPADIMAATNFDPLTISTAAGTWIVIAQTGERGPVHWARASITPQGIMVKRGVFSPSRKAYAYSLARSVAVRFGICGGEDQSTGASFPVFMGNLP
mgnify:FL=1